MASVSRPVQHVPRGKYGNPPNIRPPPAPAHIMIEDDDDTPLPSPPPPPQNQRRKSKLHAKAISDGQLGLEDKIIEFGELNGRMTKGNPELFLSLDEELIRAKNLLITHGILPPNMQKKSHSQMPNAISFQSGISTKTYYSFPISEDIEEP